MADAGWYPDPQDTNAEQYWNGQAWTGQRRPAGSSGAGAQGAAAPNVYPTQADGAAHGPTQRYASGQPDVQQPGYQQPSYQQAPYQQPGFQQPGYQQAPYQQPGYAPSYQQPGYQQAPYQQPQRPSYQQATYPPAAQPWSATPAPKAARKRRTGVVAAGVLVVLVAAGVVAWLALRGGDAPSLTYQGKAIKDAGAVLSSAESSVDRTVSARHGVKSKDTRCYFVQADKPAPGARKSDVDSSLSCGPVLFVDGNAAQEYLPVRLDADTSGSKAVLTPQSSLDSVDPSSLRSGYTLVRPDGETAPHGNGGLSVPQPPAAAADSITTAGLGSATAPATLTNAVMVGRTRKVTVSAAGFVPRYGTGADARSAPKGQKLLAFRVAYDEGAISDGTGATVKLVVGGSSHDVPTPASDEYVVAAVPDSATPTLQLTDSGDTQTLSLPQGKPGPDNIVVLTRTHRTEVLGRTFDVPIIVRKGSRTGTATFKTTVTLASLDYWPPANTSAKPSSPRNALLSVRINYKDSTQSGGPYGYDPSQLRLKLPDGTYVKPRNVAPKGKIANVFEVPAGFTTGTLQITGTQRFPNGVTSTVKTTKDVPISIPAG